MIRESANFSTREPSVGAHRASARAFLLFLVATWATFLTVYPYKHHFSRAFKLFHSMR